MKNRKDAIKYALESMSDTDLVRVWNAYNDTVYYGSREGRIYNTENDIDDELSFETPYRILNMMYCGDFNPRHTWFTFDGADNLVSFEYLDDTNSPIDLDELAEYCDENERWFDNESIWKIFLGIDEEEEDNGNS